MHPCLFGWQSYACECHIGSAYTFHFSACCSASASASLRRLLPMADGMTRSLQVLHVLSAVPRLCNSQVRDIWHRPADMLLTTRCAVLRLL